MVFFSLHTTVQCSQGHRVVVYSRFYGNSRLFRHTDTDTGCEQLIAQYTVIQIQIQVWMVLWIMEYSYPPSLVYCRSGLWWCAPSHKIIYRMPLWYFGQIWLPTLFYATVFKYYFFYKIYAKIKINFFFVLIIFFDSINGNMDCYIVYICSINGNS